MSQSNGNLSQIVMLIGNDERLVYLLQRYFEESPYQLVPWLAIPADEEIERLHPVVIIFSTIELLESAQNLLNHTAGRDIPVLVCTAVAGEAHARELGADACLLHPLTYDDFRSVLTNVCPM
jgi:CheY-like chemotaxis protein